MLRKKEKIFGIINVKDHNPGKMSWKEQNYSSNKWLKQVKKTTIHNLKF